MYGKCRRLHCEEAVWYDVNPRFAVLDQAHIQERSIWLGRPLLISFAISVIHASRADSEEDNISY